MTCHSAQVAEEGGSNLWPWYWCVDTRDALALCWRAPSGIEPETGDTLLMIALKLGMEVRRSLVGESPLAARARFLRDVAPDSQTACLDPPEYSSLFSSWHKLTKTSTVNIGSQHLSSNLARFFYPIVENALNRRNFVNSKMKALSEHNSA